MESNTRVTPEQNTHPYIRLALIMVAVVGLIIAITASVLFDRYGRAMDQRLKAGVFPDAVNIYAADIVVTVGDTVPQSELTEDLRTAGFQESDKGQPGTYRSAKNSIAVVPPAESASVPARIDFNTKQQVSRIEVKGKPVKSWSAGSPLITNLSSGREKRQMVRFREIPPVLVQAVVSAEDKHFFQHRGLDIRRIAKAAYVDLQSGRKEEGASTITMQLVRGLWLQPEKRWKRKFTEAMMTMYLEKKWSKEAIFEAYANEIYLGQQTAYSIHGFAQGAKMFFGKDLREITLPEAALLAGMVQRPSYFNPFRNPERALERRNLVLSLMRRNGYISQAQYTSAAGMPLNVTPARQKDGAFQTAYFVDRLNDELQKADMSQNGAREVYTSIDLNLQRAAHDAIAIGMKEVDRLLAATYKKTGSHAEAALIALDPHTGEIKAMVGGRDYGRSQFNRVLAKRPPGSAFKPFVYAAALNTALTGGPSIFTLATTVDDSPISIMSNGKMYRPANFHNEIFGTLTLRQALAKSDNIAAVKVAQQVGYNNVVAMARRAGLTSDIGATPSVALGSYAVTPFEIAGAYTTFANSGRYVKPRMITSVRGASGENLTPSGVESRQAIDPRIAFLMVDMLQEVMRSGTAAGVRSRGFTLPAAGKTGTSHDGWFAGFTTKLLCIVWVGFDDYSELNLEGAKSALPIWAEFMKRATRVAAYRNARPFPQPSGITSARICSESGKLAGDLCSSVRNEEFIDGTQPQDRCQQHDVQVEIIGGPQPTSATPTISTVSVSSRLGN
jgi:penicillin-binding protein 1B